MDKQHNGTLRICLFGDIELKYDSIILPKFSTKKSSSLFARLVLNAGYLFQRDALVDAFWSNISPDKAKKCLRTDLWRLRNVLDDAGVDPDLFLIAEKNGIGFKSDSKYELDVWFC